jgi:hypothetical protein
MQVVSFSRGMLLNTGGEQWFEGLIKTRKFHICSRSSVTQVDILTLVGMIMGCKTTGVSLWMSSPVFPVCRVALASSRQPLS